MGERRFLLVDSSALPDVFLRYLQARASGFRQREQYFHGSASGGHFPQCVL